MRLELRIGETVQRKAAIPRQSRRVGPCRRHGTKQPLQRLSTQTIACLRNGTRRQLAHTRQNQAQVLHHVLDRAVCEQAHPQDPPDGLLGREFSTSDRRRTRRLQSLSYPGRVEGCGETSHPLRSPLDQCSDCVLERWQAIDHQSTMTPNAVERQKVLGVFCRPRETPMRSIS